MKAVSREPVSADRTREMADFVDPENPEHKTFLEAQRLCTVGLYTLNSVDP